MIVGLVIVGLQYGQAALFERFRGHSTEGSFERASRLLVRVTDEDNVEKNIFAAQSILRGSKNISTQVRTLLEALIALRDIGEKGPQCNVDTFNEVSGIVGKIKRLSDSDEQANKIDELRPAGRFERLMTNLYGDFVRNCIRTISNLVKVDPSQRDLYYAMEMTRTFKLFYRPSNPINILLESGQFPANRMDVMRDIHFESGAGVPWIEVVSNSTQYYGSIKLSEEIEGLDLDKRKNIVAERLVDFLMNNSCKILSNNREVQESFKLVVPFVRSIEFSLLGKNLRYDLGRLRDLAELVAAYMICQEASSMKTDEIVEKFLKLTEEDSLGH